MKILYCSSFDGKGLFRLRGSNLINVQILTRIMIASFILSCIATFFEFYVDLNKDVASIHDRIQQVKQVNLPVIENSLWMIDEDELHLEVKGIIQLLDIIKAEIISKEGLIVKAGVDSESNRQRIIVQSFSLDHTMNQKTYHLGTLRIVATLDRVYSKLLDQLLRHLLVNGVKAFSLAIVILFILRELVTKHLSKMSQYAHTLRLDRLEIPLVLDKKKSSGSPPSHNELDDVVHSINKMRQSLLEGVNTMKQVEKERTHLLAQTQEMVQMRDDFISAASHELKTPATAMHLNLQLIQASFGKTMPGGLLKRFELLQRQEQRILDLIQTLFLTSALGTKEVELNLKMVNLSKLVKDSIEELSPIGTIQGCTLNSQIEPNIWACLDESRTKEIIVNLVSNALKFGKQNPIDISLRKEDQFAIITIRDYGIGIKEEDKSKIFEKYVRAASIMSFGGLGLGLYLTRKFVEAHSGKIWVESKRGQGTLFMVKLPLGTNATDDSNKLCEQ